MVFPLKHFIITKSLCTFIIFYYYSGVLIDKFFIIGAILLVYFFIFLYFFWGKGNFASWVQTRRINVPPIDVYACNIMFHVLLIYGLLQQESNIYGYSSVVSYATIRSKLKNDCASLTIKSHSLCTFAVVALARCQFCNSQCATNEN